MEIELHNVSKRFEPSSAALNKVTLSIPSGQMVGLIGPSGAGKSTLLRCTSGLCIADGPTGTISVNGAVVQEKGKLNPGIRRKRRDIGFVFQQYNLVGRLDVLTNVLIGNLGSMPIHRSLLRIFSQEEKLMALEALDKVDMAEKAFQRASTLSGGEQQRTAIARIYVQRAAIVLADEPVASLDPVAAQLVMEKLVDANRDEGKTILVSLHQVELALRYCGRIVALSEGEIVYDGPRQGLSPELLARIYGSSVPGNFDRHFASG